jgi:hypothetical protein
MLPNSSPVWQIDQGEWDGSVEQLAHHLCMDHVRSACLRLGCRVRRVRLLSQRVEEKQHLQAAFLVAHDLLDDRRRFVRVDQERRRRSAQCNTDGFQVGQLDRPPALS